MHRVGLVGLGHLGEIHLKNWLDIISLDEITCYDSDKAKLEKIQSEYQVKTVSSFDELLEVSEIIDIVTPTNFHFDLALKALESKKHVFIEKPVCESVEQAEILYREQQKANTLVQIGHVERFNPAFAVVKDKIKNPRFFEIHRLAPFVSRGTEVSVVMDLMIHDIDIVLSLVDSEVSHFYANGVKILSKTPDICNVRIEFENGCVANLTASRISMKKMRKMRVFSDIGYTSVDFLDKKSEIFEIVQENEGNGVEFINFEGERKKLWHQSFEKNDGNAIYLELLGFLGQIKNNKKDTEVNLINSLKTLSLALEIQNKIV